MTSFPKSGALRLLLLALFFLPCVSYAQRTNVDASAKMPAHPRILLLKGEEKALKKNIAKDEVWTEIHNAIIEEADKMLPLTPLERIKEGKRTHICYMKNISQDWNTGSCESNCCLRSVGCS